jgi:hypothetical protein
MSDQLTPDNELLEEDPTYVGLTGLDEPDAELSE